MKIFGAPTRGKVLRKYGKGGAKVRGRKKKATKRKTKRKRRR